ncbi:GNAT family N-acetyltransferase [Alkalibacterium thalassium]|uniref:Acetyltransferase (GNAT) domain-containing protein n=1 Tax=Alkalibacterium thalassium TaxID=426701 RepID=A0A1G8Y9V8_9LACT|nr:GNAT family N-acetyltransferase [Alkalibacterium thalassium]SDJ99477.1 Acetyltransferase (GNAT) domain-containing protein [Alkalibacterium thalassium]
MTKNYPVITYKTNSPISVSVLTDLYASVEWTGYTDHPDKMARLLDGSAYYESAWHGDHLVGLIRVVSDHASIVYIQDILVRPDYQRSGIGRKLMQSTLEAFDYIRQTVLMTDDSEETKAFYRSLGFISSNELGGLAFVKMNADA